MIITDLPENHAQGSSASTQPVNELATTNRTDPSTRPSAAPACGDCSTRHMRMVCRQKFPDGWRSTGSCRIRCLFGTCGDPLSASDPTQAQGIDLTWNVLVLLIIHCIWTFSCDASMEAHPKPIDFECMHDIWLRDCINFHLCMLCPWPYSGQPNGVS